MTIAKTNREVVKIESSLIQKLSESNIVFVLTGSRSFKGEIVHDTTDWDFFANGAKITESMIYSLGFDVLNEHYVNDPTLAKVYRAVCPVTNVQIDIQVIPDDFFEITLEAQRILEAFFEGSRVCGLGGIRKTTRRQYSDYTKEERRGLWEIAVFMASRR